METKGEAQGQANPEAHCSQPNKVVLVTRSDWAGTTKGPNFNATTKGRSGIDAGAKSSACHSHMMKQEKRRSITEDMEDLWPTTITPTSEVPKFSGGTHQSKDDEN